MTTAVEGVISSHMRRDKEGHRDYDITWLVLSDDVDDGPSVVSVTSGLAAVGSVWTFGNDNDTYAYCWPSMTIREIAGVEPGEWSGHWHVTQKFSTKPLSRCQTTSIGDPLAEPPKLSGSFTRYTREALYDRHGNMLLSSSKELIRGIETDDSNAVVNVKMNLASLPLAGATALRNHVNVSTMWGLASRSIKLTEFTWERNLFGTCSYYYTVTYGFDINFDRYIIPLVDRGTRVLSEDGDSNNPEDYTPYRHPKTGDRMEVLLNGNGGLLTDLNNPATWNAEIEKEADFLTLGIPSSL